MIKVISTVEQLEGLERDWRELEAVSGSGPFSTYAWNRTWWSYFKRGHSLMVLAAYEDGSPIGVAPFRIAGNPLSKRLEFLGSGRLADYSDFLIHPDQDRAALIDRFIDKAISIGGWHRLFLKELPAWSKNLEALDGLTVRCEDLIGESIPTSVCPFIDLDSDWEAYLAGCSRKLVKDTRRQHRRLAEAGHVEIKILTDVDDPTMEAVIRMHAPGQDSVFSNMPTRDFFIAATKRFAEDQCLHLIIVELDGRPIAFDYNLLLGGRVYGWLTGYDQVFGRFSPGRIAMDSVLKSVFERGLEEYDFMRGDEPYKARWSTGQRQSVSFDLVLNRAGSRLRNYTEQRVRPAVKKLLAKEVV